MAYEPTNWKDGDLVTAKKLNKLEQGVANAGSGGGGGMVVNVSAVGSHIVMDRTWKEIHDALPLMPVTVFLVDLEGAHKQGNIVQLQETEDEGGTEYVATAVVWGVEKYFDTSFTTDSEDGYPSAPLQ